MKCLFTFNDVSYLAPSKKEAKKFLKFFRKEYRYINRFRTTWRFKHIERAPSYGQMISVSIDRVEYGKKVS